MNTEANRQTDRNNWHLAVAKRKTYITELERRGVKLQNPDNMKMKDLEKLYLQSQKSNAISGEKIRLINNVRYATAFGLVNVQSGTVLVVKSRNRNNDGIITEEIVTLKNRIGKKKMNVSVSDKDYEIIERVNENERSIG